MYDLERSKVSFNRIIGRSSVLDYCVLCLFDAWYILPLFMITDQSTAQTHSEYTLFVIAKEDLNGQPAIATDLEAVL
jgi:hypothetical protein